MAVDGGKGGKDGASKPSTAQRPRSATITTSTSASSALVNAVGGRTRPPISKTNSSGAVLDQNHHIGNRPASSAAHTRAPPSAFPSKPVIQLESAPLDELDEWYPSDEDAEMAGPLDGEDDEEAAEAAARQHEHHVDPISRGVFDEDGGEGFYSEDEDEEVDDPEDWVKLAPEDQDEVEAVLGEIRDNFQDEVDLWDTTMVAEYADDIFAYMEELEVSPLLSHILPPDMIVDRGRELRDADAVVFMSRLTGAIVCPSSRHPPGQDDAQPAVYGVANRD